MRPVRMHTGIFRPIDVSVWAIAGKLKLEHKWSVRLKIGLYEKEICEFQELYTSHM